MFSFKIPFCILKNLYLKKAEIGISYLQTKLQNFFLMGPLSVCL